MIDTSLVIDNFLLLASIGLEDDTIELLCQSSSQRIEHLLKEDADRTDDRLIFAAASDAYYQWVLMKKTVSDDTFESFRAGDITVENDNAVSIEAARTVRDEAFDAITDLLDDRRFYFGEVQINDVEPTF